ncbi:MAG: hypothetical protein ABWY77_00650 [Acidimicrobiia bacterium]
MTDLEERLRDDLPRLAALLVDSPVEVPAEQFDGCSGEPRPRIGRRRARQTALLLCGALVVAAIAVVAVSRQTTSSQVRVPTAPASAADPDANTATIPPGEYLYIRTTGFGNASVVASGGGYTYITPATHEYWLGADRSGRRRTTYSDATFLTPENEQAFHDIGLEIPAKRRPNDRDQLLGAGEMDYFDLSEFPTDIVALRARLNEAAHVGPSRPNIPSLLIETVSDWGWQSWWHAPIAIRKGLVSVLSSTPGMTTESQDGMTVVAADRSGIRVELWFDDSGQLRRKRSVITDATIVSALRAPNGTILQDTTLEAAVLVSSTSVTG